MTVWCDALAALAAVTSRASRSDWLTPSALAEFSHIAASMEASTCVLSDKAMAAFRLPTWYSLSARISGISLSLTSSWSAPWRVNHCWTRTCVSAMFMTGMPDSVGRLGSALVMAL